MTTQARRPGSRRDRPAKPALTREGIVTAAVAVLRTEGLERLTMRRLAHELDTGPASLYVYVRNTVELHAAVLDELLAAVDLSPVRRAGDWRDRLVDVLNSYTSVLFEHPGLAQSALVTRPSGPHYLALLESLLSLLSEGQVAPAQMAWGVDLLLQTATATAAEQTARDRSIDAPDDQDALAQALRTASADTHPHVSALATDLLSGSGPDRLTWAFRVLIEGTLTTPRPTPNEDSGREPKTR